MTKFKNSKCDKTQNVAKLKNIKCDNSKTHNMTKLKMWHYSKCDNSKTQDVTTQKLKL